MNTWDAEIVTTQHKPVPKSIQIKFANSVSLPRLTGHTTTKVATLIDIDFDE